MKKGRMYVLFIDLKAAYDSVDRRLLVECLRKKGVSEQIISWINEVYKETWCKVRVGECVSERFEVRRGVRQGCPLSPLLFNLYVADMERVLEMGQSGG